MINLTESTILSPVVFLALQRDELTVAAFAEKKLRIGVKRQSEEDGLDVDLCPAVGRHRTNRPHSILDVLFRQTQAADLIACKLRSEEGAGVGPFLAVSGELTLSVLTTTTTTTTARLVVEEEGKRETYNAFPQ